MINQRSDRLLWYFLLRSTVDLNANVGHPGIGAILLIPYRYSVLPPAYPWTRCGYVAVGPAYRAQQDSLASPPVQPVPSPDALRQLMNQMLRLGRRIQIGLEHANVKCWVCSLQRWHVLGVNIAMITNGHKRTPQSRAKFRAFNRQRYEEAGFECYAGTYHHF